MGTLKCIVRFRYECVQVFVLEDGNKRVTIDHVKAGEHVRTVLSNRKRQLPGDDIVPSVSFLVNLLSFTLLVQGSMCVCVYVCVCAHSCVSVCVRVHTVCEYVCIPFQWQI